MRIRNVISAGLVAAMLAAGGVALSETPAQALPIDYCDVDLAPMIDVIFDHMVYWWNQAQWLENNGGSNENIEYAYFAYMNWSDRYDAAMSEYC